MHPQQTTFTPYEVLLFTDAEMILAKNNIMQKMIGFFGRLSDKFQAVASALPGGLLTASPKISKGEQYLGLPYVVLDYPRNFTQQHMLAIRSFFWWGNHFSIHLLLSGTHRQHYQPKLQKVFENGGLNNYYIGLGDNPWNHHFMPGNYLPASQVNDPFSDTKEFIKIAKKIPLLKWDEAEKFFIESFDEITGWLAN